MRCVVVPEDGNDVVVAARVDVVARCVVDEKCDVVCERDADVVWSVVDGGSWLITCGG